MTASAELLAQPFATMTDLVRAHARERPQRPALIEGEQVLTWRELDELAERTAAGLQRDGFSKGEAAAFCAASSLPYLAAFIGVLRAGGVACPLSPSATADQLAAMAKDCGAVLIFCDDEADKTLNAAVSPPSARRISLEGGANPSFVSWLPPAGATAQSVDVGPQDAFNIIYSSGTTGAPKGIVQPHLQRWGHVRRAETHGYGPTSVTLASTPLYSNTTLVSVVPALVRGGTVVLMRKFDAKGFLELAQRHRVTHAMLVPVQYRRIMDQPDFEAYDLSSFEMKTCTSAPFAADLKADVLRRWPGGLIEFFGMTEGGGTCILEAHLFPNKLHTVGRPAAGHDIRVIDENGHELPQGELGEVVGRSMAMMTGYHNLPQKTAETFWLSPEGDRFVRTGDVGRFDKDGFMVLGDRKKDMIISGGFNIYPSDLEAELAKHPAVAESAVVGVPSRAWGETPAAFVVLRTGQRIDPEALRAYVNERVGKMQRLTYLNLVPSLPRSSIGKILKRELRDGFRPSSAD